MGPLLSKIYFSSTLVSLIISFAAISISHGATLRWDANVEKDLAGYKVYYGVLSMDYMSFDVGRVTELDLGSLSLYESEVYWIAVTSYDTSGNESLPSSPVYFIADDGIDTANDNCADYYNPDQKDTYPPQGNGIGDACECYANFNYPNDLKVNASDLGVFKLEYGRIDCKTTPPLCKADGNNDGKVNAQDLGLFKNEYGRIDCPALP